MVLLLSYWDGRIGKQELEKEALKNGLTIETGQVGPQRRRAQESNFEEGSSNEHR